MAKYGLIIQPKSHALSLEIFNLPEVKSVWQVTAKNVGQKSSFIIESGNKKNQLNFQQGLNYVSAFRQLVKIIPKNFYVDLVTIGHPVASLGPQSAMLSVLGKPILKELKKWSGLAPASSFASLEILNESLNVFPKLKQWVISDNAWFNHLPPKAAYSALPVKIQDKFNLQKIGYQGLVHQFLFQAAASKLKIANQKINALTIYLNANCSLCLIQNGQVTDTTSGFGLTAGLFGATTSGSLDPQLITYLLDQGYTLKEIKSLLADESGWFGLSGLLDLKDVLRAAGFVVAGFNPKTAYSAEQKKRARLALAMFVYQLQKVIGGFSAVATNLQAIVWGGPIGEGSEVIRRLIWGGLHLGFKPKNLIVKVNEAVLMAKLLLTNTKTI